MLTSRKLTAQQWRKQAELFAALGDETRLKLVRRLGEGQQQSISDLSKGQAMSRQAVTKHLRVLQDVGIVQNVRQGRENLFALNPQPLTEAQEILAYFSRQWDEALQRLQRFVED